MVGVDDHLHQAADSVNWPAGVRYDPENDGTRIGSLGVHEHWNNATAMEYSRNLGTGNGIELLKLGAVVSVAEEEVVRGQFMLEQNYPNPFNPTTAISYQLPAPSGAEGSAISVVTLGVYDVLGKEVAILVDGTQTAGFHTAYWNASSMPSGVYIYRLRVVDASNHATTRYSETRKMILLR
jgi:hypothetical protein